MSTKDTPYGPATSLDDVYAQENAKLREQRDRAWAALRYVADPNHRDDLLKKEHAQAIDEARNQDNED